MKLKKVAISGFRSIKKTETLLVDDKVTILIGANDHGKTNILNAMEFLNDEQKFSAEDVNWDLIENPEINIQWHFVPSDEELNKLGELIVPDSTPEGVTPAEIFPKNTDNEIIYSRSRANKDGGVKVVSVPLNIPISKQSEILLLRPRVELFDPPTTNLKDQVTLAQLETPDFEFMQGIFRLAGIWDKRAEIFAQNDRTSKLLDEASTNLTEVLNSKWNQGKNLKWKLEHTGTNGDQIIIKIQDPSIDTRYTRPSLRSSGFRTYFLLSMITYARTENKKGNSYIYLFDEPGTYLHPHAQLDLQRSFETISEKTQIIYTTHSLFLINKNYVGRNRVISKTKDGTKIDQKPFIKNWKSVRESLGILLSNNFLIAEKSLLVEGPSDVIYILYAIKKLKGEGAIDIDLNDLSVVDAGDSSNYVAMAKLMISEGREVVALIDGDNAGTAIEKQLKKVCEQEIKDKKLQVLKLDKDKSIEDIFANMDTLRSAVGIVANNLIAAGVRVLKTGMVIESEIAKIVATQGQTLGSVIDAVTYGIFEPGEKISKLSVALQYEDLMTPAAIIPDTAEDEVKKIKTKLTLRGEKNDEGGIFQEV